MISQVLPKYRQRRNFLVNVSMVCAMIVGASTIYRSGMMDSLSSNSHEAHRMMIRKAENPKNTKRVLKIEANQKPLHIVDKKASKNIQARAKCMTNRTVKIRHLLEGESSVSFNAGEAGDVAEVTPEEAAAAVNFVAPAFNKAGKEVFPALQAAFDEMEDTFKISEGAWCGEGETHYIWSRGAYQVKVGENFNPAYILEMCISVKVKEHVHMKITDNENDDKVVYDGAQRINAGNTDLFVIPLQDAGHYTIHLLDATGKQIGSGTTGVFDPIPIGEENPLNITEGESLSANLTEASVHRFADEAPTAAPITTTAAT